MEQTTYQQCVAARIGRAQAIAAAGGIEPALTSGALPRQADITLSEAVVLGLLRQDVRRFVGIFGHGTTEIGEVLRVYEGAGLVRVFPVRHEGEASHAAAALRWVTGEKAAVFTSIGPGALHAFAASLAPASDGLGVWYLFGDETTHNEGPNMQQIPKAEQGLFLRLCQTLGQAYCLHTPQAVGTALRWGANTVDHPYRPGPFFLLLPMNTQCSLLPGFNFDELARRSSPRDWRRQRTKDATVRQSKHLPKRRVSWCEWAVAQDMPDPEIAELLDLVDGVAVTSPLVSGVIPYDHPRNMTVGGSKGSLCGNYAMENADLLVALGTRFVCQSDSSRTNYPNVRRVISINAEIEPLMHYNKTIALAGDVAATLARLVEELKRRKVSKSAAPSAWYSECRRKKQEWESFKAERYTTPRLYDDVWKDEVLTQPAAIKAAVDWARANDVVAFYDAGDVQANGFQIVEDDRLGAYLYRDGRQLHGVRGVGAPLHRVVQPAILRIGVDGRWLAHHVSADPDRWGRARLSRAASWFLTTAVWRPFRACRSHNMGTTTPPTTMSRWTTWLGPKRSRAWPRSTADGPSTSWSAPWTKHGLTKVFL